MVEILWLFIGTFLASLLTFYSGFGLGTIILSFLAVFIPIEIAIVYTAVIHLLNNVLKTVIFRNSIEVAKALAFGIPAVIGSICGALLLAYIAGRDMTYSREFLGVLLEISLIKVVIGLLLFFIGLNELLGFFEVRFEGKKTLAAGGLLSGFFGGLAGLQGAFRSYFFVKSTEEKEVFLGTSAALATLVDLSRLFVYSGMISGLSFMPRHAIGIITAALAGILVGKFYLSKVKMEMIHTLIACLLVIFGAFFALGVI